MQSNCATKLVFSNQYWFQLDKNDLKWQFKKIETGASLSVLYISINMISLYIRKIMCKVSCKAEDLMNQLLICVWCDQNHRSFNGVDHKYGLCMRNRPCKPEWWLL